MKFDYGYATGMHQMALYFIESAKADPKLLQHLFNVIDKIVDQLSQNEFTLTQGESVKAKLFEAQMNQLSALEFEATTKLDEVKNRQQTLNNEIKTIDNDIKHYQTLGQQKVKELTDKTAQCKQSDETYTSRQKDMYTVLPTSPF
jgi:hypothetical protein